MDFGFGKIFDMVEKYFGERVNRYFVALIVVAVSVYAITIIWNNVSPLAVGITNYFFGRPIDWDSFWKGLGRKSGVFVIFLGLIAVLLAISSWWVERASRNLSGSIRATHEETKEMLVEVEAYRDEALKVLERAEETLETTKRNISDHENRSIEPPTSDKEDSQG